MELKKIELFVLFFVVGLVEDLIAVFVSGGTLSIKVLLVIAAVALAFSFIEEYAEHFYILRDWLAKRKMKKQWKKFAKGNAR